MTKIYSELTEIIEKQNKLIVELINENLEKENILKAESAYNCGA